MSIFNVDGSMRKICKSKLLEFFDLDPVVRKPHNYVSLVDMGLIWRLATPTPEDREAKNGMDFFIAGPITYKKLAALFFCVIVKQK